LSQAPSAKAPQAAGARGLAPNLVRRLELSVGHHARTNHIPTPSLLSPYHHQLTS
jgi:hypothetical protein